MLAGKQCNFNGVITLSLKRKVFCNSNDLLLEEIFAMLISYYYLLSSYILPYRSAQNTIQLTFKANVIVRILLNFHHSIS